MIVVAGPESAMKEVAEVLEAVDVEGKTPPQKESKDFFRNRDVDKKP
jgi:hypothetical protein